MSFLASISWLIPLLPLLGAAVAGFAGKRYLREKSHWPIWLGVGGAAVLSLGILVSMLLSGTNEKVAFSPTYEKVAAANPEMFEAHGAKDVKKDDDHEHDDHEHDDHEHAVAEDHHDEGHHGPDGDVKAYRSTWFTWIAAGDELQRGVPPGLTSEQMAELRLQRAAAGDLLPDPEVTQVEATTGGYFEIKAGAFLDPLSAVMLGVVCGIGFLITIFAAGYMHGESGYWRFFAYLGLFLFSMTCLVMGENLIMLYLGWEGVGLCSYLLIGYYYKKPAAREAAKKAFLVNRIGDFGFAIGIMLIWWCYGTVSYFGDGVFPGFVEMAAQPELYVPADRRWALDLIPFALMLGAFGKSAQFPLYVWLPDAMEGPTPVSALIHAATMVTAGVYMISRMFPVFAWTPAAMVTITVVGAFTALFAATIALRQFDLKKVFAYSTVSQLGYMFVAVGVLAPMAGVFHLVTHAFFKALLFLSSGVVMHAMMGHLDMRKMSGLKAVLPKTRILCLVGCLCLAGFPLTSGFFSKDEIIHFAKAHAAGDWVGYLLYAVLLLTAFMTAYYTFRLYFRVFEGPLVQPTEAAPDHHHEEDDGHGTSSASAVAAGDTAESGVDAPHGSHGHDDHHHDHEPLVMIAPLAVLAVGALVAGFFQFPFHWLGSFLGDSPSFFYGWDMTASAYGGNYVKPSPGAFGYETLGFGAWLLEVWPGLLIGSVVALSGIGLAYFLHLKDRRRADGLAHKLRPFARLLEGKYYVDEIYDALVVGPLRGIGHVFYFLDRFVVDGLVYLAGFTPWTAGAGLRLATQRGALQGYAVTMLLGIALIVAFVAVM
jgi:NADH-quinone oxidoreductase subunit L